MRNGMEVPENLAPIKQETNLRARSSFRMMFDIEYFVGTNVLAACGTADAYTARSSS